MVRNSRNYNFISTDKPMLGFSSYSAVKGGDNNEVIFR
jgi:hypothetical protein